MKEDKIKSQNLFWSAFVGMNKEVLNTCNVQHPIIKDSITLFKIYYIFLKPVNELSRELVKKQGWFLAIFRIPLLKPLRLKFHKPPKRDFLKYHFDK